MKKIIAIGIIGMFLLTSITAVSAFKLEETEAKSNQPLLIVAPAEYDAEISLNDVVSFEISVSDPNGEPASFRNYEVYTRPFEEDVSYQRDGDKIFGNFTTTREGVYSLIVEITGVDHNIEKTVFYYLVNPSGMGEVRYYLRDVNPTHGQPGTGGEDGDHGDSKALLLTPPSEEEYWTCAAWVQNSPDEVPEDMPLFSILNSIDIYCWYKFKSPAPCLKRGIGIQRIVTYGMFVDKFSRIPRSYNEYTWINRKFDISWSMVCPTSWYLLSLKLIGRLYLTPVWMTKPEQPSYADFNYSYSGKPYIKSNSNLDVTILSATTQVGNSNNAEIILEGAGATNLVVQMQDTSLAYSAALNGVECNTKDASFTQTNGELIFNLQLDSEHAEHSLYISPGQSSYSSQQYQSSLFFQMLGGLQQNIR